MLFPTLLVSVFFLTLNFNHKKLYAPSDYKDEKHFMNMIEVATRYEAETKLKDELKEESMAEACEAADAGQMEDKPTVPDATEEAPAPRAPDQERKDDHDTGIQETSTDHSPVFDIDGYAKKLERDSLQELESIEKRCIMKLKVKTQIPFQRHVKLESLEFKEPLLFDALGVRSNIVHVAEIKLFKTRTVPLKRLHRTFHRASEAARMVETSGGGKVVLHLVIVVDADLSTNEVMLIKDNAISEGKRFGVTPKVYVTTREALDTTQWPFA